MNWQEYQDAVAELYINMGSYPSIKKNVYLPDIHSGQPRQIDVLLEMEACGHKLKIVIDAKYHSRPLDVKGIEDVSALAKSVGANKAVVVASNGFTKPALLKAPYLNCDTRVFSIEDALDLLVPNKWKMCKSCLNDCIVLDQNGAIEFDDGSILWWLAGCCRNCNSIELHCQECGEKIRIENNSEQLCFCGYTWSNQNGSLRACISEDVK